MSDPRALREVLEARLGRFHATQRLGLEAAHEDDLSRSRGSGAAKFFHPENWYSRPTLIRWSLTLCGLWPRAQRNARAIRLVENAVTLPGLPAAFDGFRVLHLSDLHIDASDALADAIIAAVRPVEHDLCVLTGDYRFLTAGSIDVTVRNLERLRGVLAAPVYAVLGNHDPVALVPALEAMSVRVLMNEQVRIGTEPAGFNLVGVDDRHYFGMDNLEKALGGALVDGPTVLLCHTPEIYRQAAHAGIDLLLSGHTHGGQMCLPGGWPVLLDARIPRRLGRGAWRYQSLQGYTSPGAGSSVVEGRLNCPPEITLHRFRRSSDQR